MDFTFLQNWGKVCDCHCDSNVFGETYDFDDPTFAIALTSTIASEKRYVLR